MVHLNLEALARLVDEPPSGEERAHLARCVRCRAQLDAMVEQTRELSALPPRQPPEGDWARLEARLRREGIVGVASARRSHAGSRSDGQRHPSSPPWLRAAAVAMLFAAGVASGWLLRGAGREVIASAGTDPDVPIIAGLETEGGADSAAGRAEAVEPLAFGQPAEVPAPAVDSSGEAPTESRPLDATDAGAAAPPRTALGATAGREPNGGSLQEAAELVRVAEDVYIGALLAYGRRLESTRVSPIGDPVGRYMALGNVLAVTRDAVRNAPADPFLNGLMINTIAEREATLHRISLVGGGTAPGPSTRGAP